MGDDRVAIRRTARKSAIDFYALHTFCSDEDLWRSRVEQRIRDHPQDNPATWVQIIRQREDFHRWDRSHALFLDAVNSVEENKSKILEYIRDQGETKPS
jgi:phenylalanine-4-hydroxylase